MHKDIHIKSEKTYHIPTNNGIVNEDSLSFTKTTMLFDALRGHSNLVNVKQKYPEDDKSEVELSLDVIVMSSYRYSKMLKIIEGLPGERYNSVKNYLNIE